MTYKNIRAYAKGKAALFAKFTADGQGAAAVEVENAVIEKCGETLGGTHFPSAPDQSPSVWKRRQFLAKQFVLACRERGLSTRVIHLTKHGEVR